MNKSKSPSVSVIIPTYNREEVLCDTITSALAQNYQSYEIIVVDQTSSHAPHVAAFLHTAQTEHNIHYILLETPGLPTARNVGIHAASGDIIIFCDDDVVLQPDFVQSHVEAFTTPDIGAVAGRIITAGDPDMGMPGHPTGCFLPDGNCTMGFSRSDPCFVETARGANMSFRRATLYQVGLFDTEYVGNAFREDSDLCFRIRILGYKIHFEPRAALLHRSIPAGGCKTGELPRQLRDRFYNDTRFFLKYFHHCDFSRFLWRNRDRLLFPGTITAALRSGQLRDLFAPHVGIVEGIRSYRRWRSSGEYNWLQRARIYKLFHEKAW